MQGCFYLSFPIIIAFYDSISYIISSLYIFSNPYSSCIFNHSLHIFKLSFTLYSQDISIRIKFSSFYTLSLISTFFSFSIILLTSSFSFMYYIIFSSSSISNSLSYSFFKSFNNSFSRFMFVVEYN